MDEPSHLQARWVPGQFLAFCAPDIMDDTLRLSRLGRVHCRHLANLST
jgi:hypothetical protein